MKTISRWASRHVHTAVFLIIGCEITNAFTGLLLGLNLLAEWPLALLRLLVLAMAGMIVWVRLRSRVVPQRLYSTGRGFVWAAFMGNFILFMLLGGLWGYQEQKPSPSRAVFGSHRIEVSPDTTRPERTETLRNKTRSTTEVTSVIDTKKTGKRIAYVLLFGLGLALTFLSVGLACNIACAGYGFYAILTMMLGLGFTAGGIFFLSRAFDNPLLPMRELTPAKRRRTTRRFWLLWLVLIGVLLLPILVAVFTN